MVLSAYKPAEIIKGVRHEPFNRFSGRNILVGFQFTLTALAIIFTIVVTKQLNHMRTFDLGFDKDQLMVVFNARSISNQESFKNELKNVPGISSPSLTFGYPPEIYNNSVYRVADKQEDHLFHTYYTDVDHQKSMGLRMKEGRFFENPELDKNSVVINESALKLIGWTDLVNRQILDISDDGESTSYNVVGVLEDFHFQNFKSEIKPMLLFCAKDGRYITLRLEGQDIMKSVKSVEDKWVEFADGKPFDYSFVDQQFNNLFRTEERLSNLTILFSILTIVTASLGLFGLAAFVARSRRKEFGIRKVLGAHESTIWFIQLKYFMAIALLSFAVALPVAYYLADVWLDEFIYRISNGAEIYLMAMLTVVAIILISVGYQSLKAARLSPANVLRNE
jgi:putative ABC transport system permease protein